MEKCLTFSPRGIDNVNNELSHLGENYFDLVQRHQSTDILSLKASLSRAAKKVRIKDI